MSSLLSKEDNLDDIKSIHSEQQEQFPGDYFYGAMLKALQNKVILGKKKDVYSNELFFHHFKETYLHFTYLNKIDLSDYLNGFKDFSTVPVDQSSKGLLILDLDETLIHCSFKKSNNEAVDIHIEETNQTVS